MHSGQGVLGLGVGRAKDMAKAVVKAHEKARTLGSQSQVYRVFSPTIIQCISKLCALLASHTLHGWPC